MERQTGWTGPQLHREPGAHLRHSAGPRYRSSALFLETSKNQPQEALVIKTWTMGTLGSGGQCLECTSGGVSGTVGHLDLGADSPAGLGFELEAKGRLSCRLSSRRSPQSSPTLPRARSGWGLKREAFRGAWLTQWVKHSIPDLRVVGSSPTLGVKITYK